VDAEAIADLLSGVGPVRIRRMFGGQGIYSDDVMFALEVDGELYLKADQDTVAAFRSAGSRPFAYERRGRVAEMSYWRLPETAVDEPDEAVHWARLALAAARRARAVAKVKGRRRP
jgi:DNA transformation protein